MYFDLSTKKIFIMFAIIGFLSTSVFFTFGVKNTHFGDSDLPYIFGRLFEKTALRAVYLTRQIAESGGFLATAAQLGTDRFEARESAHAVPVLVYHALVTLPDGHNVTKYTFGEHMFALKKAGWQTITLADVEAFLRGEKEIPARSFLLTFDDGAKESFYPVDPVLEALGFSAVTFILPKYSTFEGTQYYLSEGEIKTMLKTGRWELGSHGQDGHNEEAVVDGLNETGAWLANPLWLASEERIETPEEYQKRVTQDLTTSKESLEQDYNVPIYAFAFPFGEFGQFSSVQDTPLQLKEVAQEIYSLAFYQTYPGEGLSYNYPDTEGKPFMTKRIRVDPTWNSAKLIERLEQGAPKSLPYQEAFSASNASWFSVWGDYEIEDGMLHMRSIFPETGNGVVLDGTGHWQDYAFTVTVNSPQQTGVLLWARFKNSSNNVACNFGNGFVHAEQTLDGERRVIKGSRNINIEIPSGTFTVRAEVHGRTISCFLNGQEMVTSEFVDPSLSKGGIGIKIWDQEPGKSELSVDSVSVIPL